MFNKISEQETNLKVLKDNILKISYILYNRYKSVLFSNKCTGQTEFPKHGEKFLGYANDKKALQRKIYIYKG